MAPRAPAACPAGATHLCLTPRFTERRSGKWISDLSGWVKWGEAIATNLLKAGHTVRVWNRSRERAEPLAAVGAQIVDTPADAFRGDAVFSMLADDAARAIFDDALLAQRRAA